MSKKKKGNRKRREPALAPTLEALKARAEGILVHMDRREIILGQMDTAIWLWFNDKDIVSIQVLAGSAHQNLDALGSGIGKGPTLKNDLGWDRLYFAYDVFRHASANPNESFDFALVSNEVLLTDATVSFESIFGHRTPWMNTFAAFMMLPTIFKKSTDGLFLKMSDSTRFEISLVKRSRPRCFRSTSDFFIRTVPRNFRTEYRHRPQVCSIWKRAEDTLRYDP